VHFHRSGEETDLRGDERWIGTNQTGVCGHFVGGRFPVWSRELTAAKQPSTRVVARPLLLQELYICALTPCHQRIGNIISLISDMRYCRCHQMDLDLQALYIRIGICFH
jgi:hypothetical protein